MVRHRSKLLTRPGSSFRNEYFKNLSTFVSDSIKLIVFGICRYLNVPLHSFSQCLRPLGHMFALI